MEREGNMSPVPVSSFNSSNVFEMVTAEDIFNGTNSSDPTSPPPGLQRALGEIVIVGAILGTIILVTILGNLLVCVTIATNTKLHNFTNFFILSLATTDLLLGSLVLPFSAVNTLSDHWPLGAIFCNFYNASDVMLCTVSILTLFAISLDRYFAVTIPLRYQQHMHVTTVWKVNAGIWVFSLIMAFIPIHVGLNTPDGSVQNWARPNMCVFELNRPYAMLVAVGTYFAPLMVMCGVYMKVLQITRKQVKEINKLSKAGSGLAQAMLSLEENGETLAGTNNSSRHKNILRQKSHKEHKIVSDRKATVTLASVVLAFGICWIPYFLIFTAKPFISLEINIHLDLFALWLGYVNSSINPFLYAFYNSTFREAFRKVLCRRWTETRPRIHMERAKKPHYTTGGVRGSNSDTSELSYIKHQIS